VVLITILFRDGLKALIGNLLLPMMWWKKALAAAEEGIKKIRFGW